MPAKKKSDAKGLDEIRRLQTIKDVISRGAMENLLAYGSAKDSEAASENAADNLINQIADDKSNKRDITIIENLTKEGPGGETITKKKSVTFTPQRTKKLRIKRNIHMVKHIGSNYKSSKKAGSKKASRRKG